MKKIISSFITMLMLSCFIFPLCVTVQENSIDIKYKLQKGNRKAVIYTNKIDDIKNAELNLQYLKKNRCEILYGEGTIFSNDENWKFTLNKLKLFQNHLYIGAVTFLNKSTKKEAKGIVYINTFKNVISGMIKEKRTVYFYSGSDRYNEQYMHQYLTEAKSHMGMNKFSITRRFSYTDDNIMMESNDGQIAAHFIGKPEIISSNKRRYSFRMGLLNEVEGYYPEDCEFYKLKK